MKNPGGHVYVIGNVGHGVVKIGYAKDVASRLRGLMTSYTPPGVRSDALVVLRDYPSERARQLELALHSVFASARLTRVGMTLKGLSGRTEWFALGVRAAERVDYRVGWLAEEWARLDRLRGDYAAC